MQFVRPSLKLVCTTASSRITRSLPIGARCFCAGQIKSELVPSMGDSITEGSIVEWVKQVGDYVAVDDVVVVVETDKVTIDIRAEQAGTIRAFHAQEEDVVEVGALLYDMELGVGTPPPKEDKPKETHIIDDTVEAPLEANTPAAFEASTVSSARTMEDRQTIFLSHSHRTPLIQFKHGVRTEKATISDGITPDVQPGSSIIIDESILRGRPTFSEIEIEHISSGGADLLEKYTSIY